MICKSEFKWLCNLVQLSVLYKLLNRFIGFIHSKGKSVQQKRMKISEFLFYFFISIILVYLVSIILDMKFVFKLEKLIVKDKDWATESGALTCYIFSTRHKKWALRSYATVKTLYQPCRQQLAYLVFYQTGSNNSHHAKLNSGRCLTATQRVCQQ